MLKAGPAKKVSIYVGEDHQYHGQSLYSAILDFLFYRGISGASVTRGVAGFGADHHLHTTRIEALTQDLPMKVEFIESSEKVEEVLPKTPRAGRYGADRNSRHHGNKTGGSIEEEDAARIIAVPQARGQGQAHENLCGRKR